jgi:hypothetical protein
MTRIFLFRAFAVVAWLTSHEALAQASFDDSGESADGAASRTKPKSKVETVPVHGVKSKPQDLPPQTKESLAPTPDQTSWWSPKGMQHSIGIELSDSSFGVLGADAVAYGFSTEKFGLDFYLAYEKEANTASESVTQTTNDAQTPKTKEVTTSYNGSVNPRQTTIGFQPKYIFYSDRWFKASFGFMLAQKAKTSVSYKTGSITKTYSDSSKLSDYSVSETDFGTVSSTVSSKMIYGPRLNVEFYLKWFPHISLGFGTGLLQTQGGDVTNSRNTQTRSYKVTNGVSAEPTSSETTSETGKIKTGGTSKTVAVGGTKFSLLGNFAIRYIW